MLDRLEPDTFHEAIRRHEGLRTTFHTGREAEVQRRVLAEVKRPSSWAAPLGNEATGARG